MAHRTVDPVELNAAVSGLEQTLADLPEDGLVVMPARAARSLYGAALRLVELESAITVLQIDLREQKRRPAKQARGTR